MATNGQRRSPPPVYFFAAIAAMAAAHLWFPIATLLDAPYSWLGAVPILLGLGLSASCARLFKRAGATIKPFGESAALVRRGPYAYSRNPMYLGLVLMLIGIALILGTLTPFFVIPVFVALLQSRVIRAEETVLERKFGSRFAEYRREVRRWL